jgi:D-alanyl-lipoteichoic acid acyltransferase DltB (MBOAT superfamily)
MNYEMLLSFRTAKSFFQLNYNTLGSTFHSLYLLGLLVLLLLVIIFQVFIQHILVLLYQSEQRRWEIQSVVILITFTRTIYN